MQARKITNLWTQDGFIQHVQGWETVALLGQIVITFFFCQVDSKSDAFHSEVIANGPDHCRFGLVKMHFGL